MTAQGAVSTSPDLELPDSRGRFGDFGGRYVPETLMSALLDLEVATSARFYRAVGAYARTFLAIEIDALALPEAAA